MPQATNTISLGNILTIVTMAVMVIVAWTNVSAQTSQHAAEIADHESRLRVIETKVGETLSRIDERLASIERKLAKVPATSYPVQE